MPRSVLVGLVGIGLAVLTYAVFGARPAPPLPVPTAGRGRPVPVSEAPDLVTSDPSRASMQAARQEAAAGPAAAAARADGLQVVGRVLAPDGRPADGETVVLVSLVEGPRRPFACTAPVCVVGADGRFSFEVRGNVDATDGMLALRVDSGRWAMGAFRKTVRFRERIADVGDLRLAHGGVVVGRVTDASGVGIAGAELELQPGEGHPQLWVREGRRPDPERRTDAAGAFRVERLMPGPFRLAARAKGHVRASSPRIEVRDGEVSELEPLVLGPGFELGGTVRTPDGEPIADARITVRRALEVRSDERGQWLLEHVPPGLHSLSVRAEGFLSRDVEGVDPALRPRIELVLEPGLSVRGRVVDADGAPVETFAVRATRVGDPEGELPGPALTMALGRPLRATPEPRPGGAFVVDGIEREGRYRIQIRSPDHLPGTSDEVQLRRGWPAPELQIELEAGLMLAGVVVDAAGEPIADAGVWLEQEIGKDDREGFMLARMRSVLGAAYRTRSDQKGGFRLGPVPPGAYRLRGLAAGFVAVENPPFDVDADRSDLRLVLDPQSVIEGRVTGVPAGRMDEVVVMASRRGRDALRLGGFVRTTTDPQGAYRVEVTPGDYAVRAALEGDREALMGRPPGSEREVSVEAGATLTLDVPLTITPRGRIRGHVFDRQLGAEGYRPFFERASDPPGGAGPFGEGRFQDVTGNDGAFDLEGVPAGQGALVVRSPAGAEVYRVPLTVRDGSETVHDVHVSLGVLAFDVQGASPEAVRGGTLVLTREIVSLSAQLGRSPRLVGVPLGEWRYCLSIPGHKATDGTLTVEPGERTVTLQVGSVRADGGERARKSP